MIAPTASAELPVSPAGLETTPDQLPSPRLRGGFSPELLYAECASCGTPLLWNEGATVTMLAKSGVDVSSLDLGCLLLAEGCARCQPDKDAYGLRIVRLEQQ